VRLRGLYRALVLAGVTNLLHPSSGDAAAGDIYFSTGLRTTGQVAKIVRLDSSGAKNTFVSGGNPYGLAFDRAGNLFVAIPNGGNVVKYTPDGQPTTFANGLGRPGGLAMDSNDNLFVADLTANAIVKITPDGTKTTYASGLNKPSAVTFDKAGNLYCSEIASGQVVRISTSGDKTTIASGLSEPQALAFDQAGNLFVIEGAAPNVFKIAPDLTRTLFYTALARGLGLCFNLRGNLVVTDNAGGGLFVVDQQGTEISNDFDVQSPIHVAVEPPTSNSVNIATRIRVLKDDKALFAGFIVTGTEPKKVLIRGIGPSLSNFGLSGTLADPTLELHDQSGSLLAVNDDWKEANESEIAATGIPPTDNKEAAILTTLPPGSYTAIERGKGNTEGIALIEIYDLAADTHASLANISSRGFVDTGSNVMIGGFIVGGGNGSRILVRALGPSLGAVGVANALANPTLELRDGNGNLLRSNDNWKDQQRQEIEFVGIPPANDLESAIAATVPPGNYTAVLAGANGATGIGLLEIYNVK